ncbi:MAG: methyltransferase domain-containing protein [Candidatus Eisenbacteria sp.]|nr:methyltransferase domain-containing protein [Candidatus Eisenbacteria bacterium]
MFDLEDRYWWFRGRRELARSLLSRFGVWRDGDRILDVGCGTGSTLAALSDLGTTVGLDASPEALRFCRNRNLSLLVRSPAGRIPFQNGTFHAAVALDLLEHVSDEQSVLQEIHRVVRPGGLTLVTVPAFQFLWSRHDVALHHLRRYRAGEIARLMEDAGFAILKLSYAVSLLFFPIALYRLLEKLVGSRSEPETTLKPVPGPLNTFFYWLLCLEARWMRFSRLPFGVSVVCVGQKREDRSRQG